MAKRQATLVLGAGTPDERKFPFVDRIEIGRLGERPAASAVRIELEGPTISYHHCLVTQDAAGRFLVRDLSRNGTRLDGKRLRPNLDAEIRPGQTLAVGDFSLTLRTEGAAVVAPRTSHTATVVARNLAMASLVVGDIRGYTTLNQREDPDRVARSLHELFSQLEKVIAEHGGNLKEVPGDAVFAFWELSADSPAETVCRAVEAARALERRASEFAEDPAAWPFPEFPLQMDFAIATGVVSISNFGAEQAIGISMVGDAVNLVFQIEKLATDKTGPVLACATTRLMAGDRFDFEDLGEAAIEGREGRLRLFALQSGSTAPR